MSLLAPIISGVVLLLIGVAVLIWMSQNQPQLQTSPAAEPDSEDEPSLIDVWEGRIPPEALKQVRGYKQIVVHHQ